MGLNHFSLMQALPRSLEVMREAFGTSYDPGMGKRITLLALAELAVFIDYGHWRLASVLERPVLQGAGLLLYLLALIWMRRVDECLARHFASEQASRAVITDGPYRYVRHPRYSGLIASRVAFALTFASILGWMLMLGWVVVVLRRIKLEEPHLQELFGAEYDHYAKRTARLIYGLY